MREWKTAKRKMAELNPAPYNPRNITDKALSGLGASIDRFGMVEPIVWNKRTGNIVGGHQRHRVLASKGVVETEVVEVDLDEQEEKALNLALNNPATRGEFTDGAKDLLDRLEKSCSGVFDALLMNELRFLVERLKTSQTRPEEAESKAARDERMGKTAEKKPGLECPRCHCAWDAATKKVFRKGVL